MAKKVKRRPPRGQRPGQRAIREARFERSLQMFNDEIGQKVAMTIHEYHSRFIRPLEERIEYLEAPPWKKLWVRWKRTEQGLKASRRYKRLRKEWRKRWWRLKERWSKK